MTQSFPLPIVFQYLLSICHHHLSIYLSYCTDKRKSGTLLVPISLSKLVNRKTDKIAWVNKIGKDLFLKSGMHLPLSFFITRSLFWRKCLFLLKQKPQSIHWLRMAGTFANIRLVQRQGEKVPGKFGVGVEEWFLAQFFISLPCPKPSPLFHSQLWSYSLCPSTWCDLPLQQFHRLAVSFSPPFRS